MNRKVLTAVIATVVAVLSSGDTGPRTDVSTEEDKTPKSFYDEIGREVTPTDYSYEKRGREKR